MKRPYRRLFHFSLFLVVFATLAGCSEESSPQFANEPAPTRSSTSTPTAATAVAIQATPVAATPASIADVIATRGAPQRVYLAANSGVWVISSSGDSDLVYETAAEERVVSLDAAPGGDQVAIVLASMREAGEHTDVAIVDSSGEIVARLDDINPVPATPGPGGGEAAPATVDWSPQSDRALVSFPQGPIVELPIGSEEVRTLMPAMGGSESIVHPTWSPTGEAVAFIASGDNGRKRPLKVIDTRTGSVRAIVTPTEGRFVVDYSWMPNGVSLLFTEGGEFADAVTGIDLWKVDASGENRELVVSAGTVAPVARIANVQPSPDGRSVAYSVLVPGGEDPQVDSVWVRDLGSRLGFRIQMPSAAAVNDISWTDRGLVIEVVTGGRGAGQPPAQALVLVSQDGAVQALWAAPFAPSTPVSGTPAATPQLD